MLKKFTQFLIISLIIFSAQMELIGQSADHTKGCVGLLVNFEAPNIMASYYWDFKDGSKSEKQNPQNTYVGAGVYNVELWTKENGTLVGTVEITVFEKPTLEIDVSPKKGCIPLDIQITDNSLYPDGMNVTSYAWVFNDGGSSSINNPIYTYNTEGVYDISMTIETDLPNCTTDSTFAKVVEAQFAPIPKFTTTPSILTNCTGPVTYSFNNTTPNLSNFNYSWDMGNGNVYNSQNPPDQTYTEEGNYEVKLTASNSSCSNVEIINITIGDPVVDLEFPDVVCPNQIVPFVNKSSIGVYEWDFGPNGVTNSNVSRMPSFLFTKGGTQSISLKVTSLDGNCSATKSFDVNIDFPNAKFTMDPPEGCEYINEVKLEVSGNTDNVNYFWKIEDESFLTPVVNTEFVTQLTHKYDKNVKEEFEILLTTETENGCTDSYLDTFIIHRPNALFMPDTVKGCAPLEVIFSDSSTVQVLAKWDWDYGDGNFSNLTSGADHSKIYNNTGTYEVFLQVENDLGCRDTSYGVTIEVGEPVSLSVNVDNNNICIGDTVHFSTLSVDEDLIDDWHIFSDNGRTSHCADIEEFDWVFETESGQFNLNGAVLYNGCETTIENIDEITVKGPVARIAYSMDCATPFEVMFRDSSDEATSITWDFADGNTSTDLNPTHTYSTVGDYWVKLTAENSTTGCSPHTDSVLICIRDLKPAYELEGPLCTGKKYNLDATTSVDVDARCYRGYTWFFEISNRPLTTDLEVTEFNFGVPGEEYLTLEVTDINGCKDSITKHYTIYDVRPNFTLNPAGPICFPSDVEFADLTEADTLIDTYEWDFGDDMTSDTQDSIFTHTYNSSPHNPIPVMLTVTDVLGCVGEKLISLDIETIDTKIISPQDKICVGGTASFVAEGHVDNGGDLTFSWDFGNGETSEAAAPEVVYNQVGIFPVVLTYSKSGCIGVDSLFMQVIDNLEPHIMTNPGIVDGECAPIDLTLFANSGSDDWTYSWDFGNGQTSVFAEPTIRFQTGTYQVSLTVTDKNNCTGEDTFDVNLIGSNADYDISRDSVCLDEEIVLSLKDTANVESWYWEIEGVKYSGVDPLSFSFDKYPQGGFGQIKLVVSTPGGSCTSELADSIFVHELDAEIILNQNFYCMGDELVLSFTGTGVDSHVWILPDGMTTTDDTPSFTFDTNGSYPIQLEVTNNSFGCSLTLLDTIQVGGFDIIIEGKDTICLGEEVTLEILNPNDGVYYSWEPTGNISDYNVDSTMITTFELNVDTEFLITGSTGLVGCEATKVFEVFVIVDDLEDIMDTFSVVSGKAKQLPEHLEDLNYNWTSFDAEIDDSKSASPYITTTVETDVNSIVTDDSGCKSANFLYHILIANEKLDMPNIFTPNGDGKNDFFYFRFEKDDIQNFEVEEFIVFDRLGNKVYENQDPNKGWDGNYNGKPSLSDAYRYIATVFFPETGNRKTVSGDVTLVR